MSFLPRLLTFTSLAFLSFTAATLLRAENAPTALITKTHETLPVGDLTRAYTLVRPAQLNPDTPQALLIGFHGYRGEVKTWLHDYVAFDSLIIEKNLIIAYPEAPIRWTHSTASSDLAFFDALVTHLSKTYPIDTARIYAFGHSNGASFATYLLSQRAETLAAVAAHSGLYPLRQSSAKRPILVLWGENDEFAPAASNQVQATVKAYQSAGYTCDFIALAKWGHSWGGTTHKVEETMIDFLLAHPLPPKISVH